MLNFFSRLLGRRTEQVVSAAFLLGAASFASRIVGVVRDRLLASHFGAGSSLDAYYAAFRWPDALYNLMIVGALTAGFIPVLSECREKEGEEAGARLAGQVLSITILVLIVICLFLVSSAQWIVPLTVRDFPPERLQETIKLTRIMALSPLLLGVSAVMGGVLQVHKRFFAFAFAPIFYNVGIIFGILVFAPRLGIYGVAIGVVLGAALHALIQIIPVLRTHTLSLSLQPWKRMGYVKKIFALMGPRTVGLAITQVNLVILLALASGLPDGSVSVLAFANNIQSVPLGLIGISFAVAALPALAEAAAKRDRQKTTQLVVEIMRQVLVLVIPLALCLILLRAQVVRMLLGHGAFDWNDTARTAALVAWFAVSLPAQALIPLFARVWYAHQNASTPLLIGVVAEIVNVSAALLLRSRFGVVGLAMAFSLSSFIHAIGLWWLLRRRKLVERPIPWDGFWKMVLALLSSLVVGYVIRQLIGTVYPLRAAWQVWLQGGLSGLVSLFAYALIAHFTRLKEWRSFSDLIFQRLSARTRVSSNMPSDENNLPSL